MLMCAIFEADPAGFVAITVQSPWSDECIFLIWTWDIPVCGTVSTKWLSSVWTILPLWYHFNSGIGTPTASASKTNGWFSGIILPDCGTFMNLGASNFGWIAAIVWTVAEVIKKDQKHDSLLEWVRRKFFKILFKYNMGAVHSCISAQRPPLSFWNSSRRGDPHWINPASSAQKGINSTNVAFTSTFFGQLQALITLSHLNWSIEINHSISLMGEMKAENYLSIKILS